jgi:glycosyltransferase involved in cell wall biosynthesis
VIRPTHDRRVLMLLGNGPFPADSRVRNEAKTLTAAGYRVAVIAPARRGEKLRERVDGIDVFRYPDVIRGSSPWMYVLEYAYTTLLAFLLSIIVSARHRPDVVHAHNPPDSYFLIGYLFKLFGSKFVYDHHDLSPELYCVRFPDRTPKRSVHRALVLLERLSCRVADRIIATNKSYRRIESERAGVPVEKITVVRNGPSPEKLKVEEIDPALRTKAGTIIGFVGNMGYQDGVDYLLRALRHLVYDLAETDVYCVLIGRGEAREDLRELARKLGLEGYTWFPGYISDRDVRRILCTADICVDPDPSTEFNDLSTMLKIMDYMALGRAVVAFDLPEHRVTAGEAAIFVKPNDELEMARAIAALIKDEERRRKLGAAGRRRVAEGLLWQHSAVALVELYTSLLGTGGPHDDVRATSESG